MSLLKECADKLRHTFFVLTGHKLKAGHAQEIVAAYFSYGTAAALRDERAYPLDDIRNAAILIPDVALMDSRRPSLVGLPEDLPPSAEIAQFLSEFLREDLNYDLEIWDAAYLSDDINGYIQNNPSIIEDELSGEMAETNAFFDEIYLDEVVIDTNDDALIATISGELNGETHEDKAFHGDKISFTSVMTLPRVAGRNAYAKPEFETAGGVDRSYFKMEA